MRTDKAPFNDIRVRRALTMSIDYDTLIATLTGGTGVKMVYPGTRDPVYKETWLSFDEAPKSVQELYTYNPEKAKQLLKEAGYPSGLKTTVLTPPTSIIIDNMSILKAMWAKVGVDLAIDTREQGVFNSLAAVRNYDQLITGVGLSGGSALMQGNRMQGEGQVNMSYINDPNVNDVYAKVQPLMFTNPAEAMGNVKEMLKYVYDQAWFFSFPSGGPNYTFWWPWLKNFYGDTSIGWFNSNFAQFAWIDQEMKKSMGY
jgi:peptide/nickel transport system substrate-binding protein